MATHSLLCTVGASGQRLNFDFVDLSGANEAEFEALSVQYACKKATNLNLAAPRSTVIVYFFIFCVSRSYLCLFARRFVIACGGGSIQMVDLMSDADSQFKFCSIDAMGNNIGAYVYPTDE